LAAAVLVVAVFAGARTAMACARGRFVVLSSFIRDAFLDGVISRTSRGTARRGAMPSESFTYRPDLRHAALGLMSMKTSIPYNFRHEFRVRPLFQLLPGGVPPGWLFRVGRLSTAIDNPPQRHLVQR